LAIQKVCSVSHNTVIDCKKKLHFRISTAYASLKPRPDSARGFLASAAGATCPMMGSRLCLSAPKIGWERVPKWARSAGARKCPPRRGEPTSPSRALCLHARGCAAGVWTPAPKIVATGMRSRNRHRDRNRSRRSGGSRSGYTCHKHGQRSRLRPRFRPRPRQSLTAGA